MVFLRVSDTPETTLQTRQASLPLTRSSDEDPATRQTPAPALAYDVARLFLSPLSLSPRGIDRIDLMLAEYFFRHGRENVWGSLPTPWGVRLFPAWRVRRGLEQVRVLWREDGEPDSDAAFQNLVRRLRGDIVNDETRSAGLSIWRKYGRMFSMLRATGFTFGRSPTRTLPPNAAYLNVGHLVVSLRLCLRWLKRRPDIHAVFMVHDAIPLTRPDLVEPRAASFHRAVINNTQDFATGMIVSTDTARSEIEAHFNSGGGALLATKALHLPLSDTFGTVPPEHPELSAIPYFLVCGAIEKRKNLPLLARTWKHLAETSDETLPQLAVVGPPNFGFSAIRDEFRASGLLGREVHFAHGVSSRSLAILMANAKALLMPSLAEGFGLPLKEAKAMGCPVIASDIPAHREVLESYGTLLPVDDPIAWSHAIRSHLTETIGMRRDGGTEGIAFERETFAREVERFLATGKLSGSAEKER